MKPADEPITVHKAIAYVPIPDELAMEYGLIPDTRPSAPPPPWHRRLCWRAAALREAAARRLYSLVAGHDLEPADD